MAVDLDAFSRPLSPAFVSNSQASRTYRLIKHLYRLRTVRYGRRDICVAFSRKSLGCDLKKYKIINFDVDFDVRIESRSSVSRTWYDLEPTRTCTKEIKIII